MRQKLRIFLYLVSALLFGVVFVAAMAGLPNFGNYRGPYGDLVMQTVLPLRQTQQGVAAVTFDYRGFDTVCEEFILFAAVAGAILLMRHQESEEITKPTDRASDRSLPAPGPAVIGCGVVMFPFTLLLGIYVVLHGHLSPGGGFQGGVLLATAFYFVYLSGEYRDLLEFMEGHVVTLFKVTGAAAFALLGVIPMLRHHPYMLNVMPLGKAGELLSSGFLPLDNCSVGLEVAAGFLLLISAFLRQVLVIRKRRSP
ncbi:MnhB domain-containing protein [Geomonas sp.]|uniref:MnhB domain-containing protein n=1 Tax=Geomonas sp. TaxID=2651584 RepID=UPI002B4A0A1B|nr:MnhB domain-containing protein [Geomonas sp.]HJV33858.1 MnhB domain-containing protein [Geomonas sp.]